MAWGAYVTGLVLLTQRDPDGRPTYPTTRSLIPELDNAIGMMLVGRRFDDATVLRAGHGYESAR